MEEKDCENSLHYSPLAFNRVQNNNAYGLHADCYENQYYVTTPGSNDFHQEHVLVGPQWMHCQRTPQNYVDLLSERVYPEIQKQMFYEQVPMSGLADPSQLDEHAVMRNVGNYVTTVTSSTPQYGVQGQYSNGESSHAFQAYSGSPKCTSEVRRKRSREKASAADRSRRLRISRWLDALKELVPHSKESGKAGLLDSVIDHVKHLQNQVKDLSGSRLRGEPASNSLIFLEGHGHYIVQDQMINGPLEQMMGKLIDDHPSQATQLLQSKGLIVMPMSFAHGLFDVPTKMLDMMQG